MAEPRTPPVLVITDGAPQRCLAHKTRNLETKVPAERWREFGPMARAVYQASSPALARLARDEFVKTWSPELPSATACFEDDFEACIAHLRLPVGHRRVIRTTNLLERMFGEERRRTQVIPHAFGNGFNRHLHPTTFHALLFLDGQPIQRSALQPRN